MQFYVLRPMVGSSHETEFEKADPVRRGEAARCPACGDGYISLKAWLPPYRVNVRTWGEGAGDFIFGVWDLLVSDRFRLAWTNARLRGLDAFEQVEIAEMRGRGLSRPAPVCFRVAPHCGPTALDFQRSFVERTAEPLCLACGQGATIQSVQGLSIAESTWSGEDMFRPLGMADLIVASARLHDLITGYDLKNANLVPLEQYVWPPSGSRKN